MTSVPFEEALSLVIYPRRFAIEYSESTLKIYFACVSPEWDPISLGRRNKACCLCQLYTQWAIIAR